MALKLITNITFAPKCPPEVMANCLWTADVSER